MELPPLLDVRGAALEQFSFAFPGPTPWWRRLMRLGRFDTVKLVLTAHAIQVGDQVFGFHELTSADFVCARPVTTLVLRTARGEALRIDFVRRGQGAPARGVTRRQREWLIAFLDARIEACSGSPPAALVALREDR